jgi:glutaredoxin 3
MRIVIFLKILIMIIMYVKPGCPFCSMAKNLLEEKNISYEIKDIYNNEEEKKELFEESDMFTFPQIFVENVKKEKLI